MGFGAFFDGCYHGMDFKQEKSACFAPPSPIGKKAPDKKPWQTTLVPKFLGERQEWAGRDSCRPSSGGLLRSAPSFSPEMTPAGSRRARPGEAPSAEAAAAPLGPGGCGPAATSAHVCGCACRERRRRLAEDEGGSAGSSPAKRSPLGAPATPLPSPPLLVAWAASGAEPTSPWPAGGRCYSSLRQPTS